MTAATYLAPTDAQLQYIKSLCLAMGVEPPEAIGSKLAAGLCIEELKRGEYRPADWRVTADYSDPDYVADDWEVDDHP